MSTKLESSRMKNIEDQHSVELRLELACLPQRLTRGTATRRRGC